MAHAIKGMHIQKATKYLKGFTLKRQWITIWNLFALFVDFCKRWLLPETGPYNPVQSLVYRERFRQRAIGNGNFHGAPFSKALQSSALPNSDSDNLPSK
ncbi:hypothetical protein U0070_024375 [Myodes glareolus]|uniref:PiggyBac transposable element-derived protein domain-containing protein n=1 Tax=Myodes glareolus TaxID=447135 RepID=A0AAW0IKV6_MYOGA